MDSKRCYWTKPLKYCYSITVIATAFPARPAAAATLGPPTSAHAHAALQLLKQQLLPPVGHQRLLLQLQQRLLLSICLLLHLMLLLCQAQTKFLGNIGQLISFAWVVLCDFGQQLDPDGFGSPLHTQTQTANIKQYVVFASKTAGITQSLPAGV